MITPTPGLIQRLISQHFPDSPKRALILASGGSLILGFLALVAAVWYQVARHWPVESQLVLALLGVGASVATLAGVAHRKPDSSIPPAGGFPLGAGPQAGADRGTPTPEETTP